MSTCRFIGCRSCLMFDNKLFNNDIMFVRRLILDKVLI